MPDRPRILQACSPCGSPTSRRSPTRDPGLAPSTLTDPRPRASPGAYFRSAVAAAHRAPEPGALTGRRTTPRRHKLRRRSSRRQLPPTKPIARPSQTPTLARYHDHTSEPTPLRKPTPAPTAMALAVTAGQPHPPGFYGAAHPSAQNRGAAALPTDFPTFVPLQRSPEPGIRPRCRPHRLPAAEPPAHGRADEISLAGFHRTLTRRPSSQSFSQRRRATSHQSPPTRPRRTLPMCGRRRPRRSRRPCLPCARRVSRRGQSSTSPTPPPAATLASTPTRSTSVELAELLAVREGQERRQRLEWPPLFFHHLSPLHIRARHGLSRRARPCITPSYGPDTRDFTNGSHDGPEPAAGSQRKPDHTFAHGCCLCTSAC